ncbi:hypothetical protein GGR52DRAFT_240829 [Hypoxylon sp. FL1284]|nr:hypothetical protein GGR52DRAFT_240829 [Hypoxylon sp. FL1284]
MTSRGPPIRGSSGGHAGESLSCLSCRNRKLKCDRTQPRCNRCVKAKTECVYPESRRKPATKRRNVKEIEARLAQVEELLKENSQSKSSNDGTAGIPSFESIEVPAAEDDFLQGLDFTSPGLDENTTFNFQPDSMPAFPTGNLDGSGQDEIPFDGDLMDLGGVHESLPPFNVMEDLNRAFFERHQHIVPVVHPSRYLHAFYAAPHMKPPMCLRYAIWALASHGHPKYGFYHDIFYKRARQYADSDEMKGYGEHFITVAHAQAWCIIATYEAKSMMFTRASMSCSRGVRLVQMMGLHRLDGGSEEISPTLVPPKDWTELEERRRVFWGTFCIDSHCSISTGWPHLIDASEITTLLPASESAFHEGAPMETCSVQDAFRGRPYSSFAGAVLVCHLFNEILKHIHKPKPNDNPDNYEYGEYWQRHRDIDNTLSSAFMNLPEVFRLPENYRDPVAVHTNLNLHASIICLHHSAIDRIDTYKLPENAKRISQDRLTTAAQEIINIVKLTASHANFNPRSPLASLALYCAASVYIYMCKETQVPTGTYADNLNFVIAAMEALGRTHTITRAFLRQVVVDIERNDIQHIVRLPSLDDLGDEFSLQVTHNIPLVARSSISRHSGVQPPLPGRLPLGKPVGRIIRDEDSGCEHGTWTSELRVYDSPSAETHPSDTGNSSKRKRTSMHGATSTLTGGSEASDRLHATSGAQDRASARSSPANPLGGVAAEQATVMAYPVICGSHYGAGPQHQVDLPHRTCQPNVEATNAAPTSAPPPPSAQDAGHTGAPDVAPLMGTIGSAGGWDAAGFCVNAQMFNANRPGAADPQRESVPWSLAGHEAMNVDWDAIGAFGTDPGGASGSGPGGSGGERRGDGGAGLGV